MFITAPLFSYSGAYLFPTAPLPQGSSRGFSLSPHMTDWANSKDFKIVKTLSCPFSFRVRKIAFISAIFCASILFCVITTYSFQAARCTHNITHGNCVVNENISLMSNFYCVDTPFLVLYDMLIKKQGGDPFAYQGQSCPESARSFPAGVWGRAWRQQGCHRQYRVWPGPA